MKCVIIIPAGLGDAPLDELGGKTPLEAARIPALDRIATAGRVGTAVTIPPGRTPSAEIGLLSVLGYDPREYHAARGPLEALAQGVTIGPEDLVFRCNLITLVDGYLVDFTAEYIDDTQAQALISGLNDALKDETVRFLAGYSYRHLFVWQNAGAEPRVETTDPQTILEQPVRRHMPRGLDADPLERLVRWSQRILTDHDVNLVRRDLGERPANSVWVYGNGPAVELPSLRSVRDVHGALIAGTDLARGLGAALGMHVPDVPGATGMLETNLRAKAQAALAALDDHELVCVHIEALDEAGHLGEAQRKIALLEALDQELVAPLYERLVREKQHRILVMPSHATPLDLRKHSDEAVVFALAGTGISTHRGESFDEATAEEGEMHLDRASDLMEYLLSR